MDSFTCGVCRAIFHSLEEFGCHKQTHDVSCQGKSLNNEESLCRKDQIELLTTPPRQFQMPVLTASSSKAKSDSTACDNLPKSVESQTKEECKVVDVLASRLVAPMEVKDDPSMPDVNKVPCSQMVNQNTLPVTSHKGKEIFKISQEVVVKTQGLLELEQPKMETQTPSLTAVSHDYDEHVHQDTGSIQVFGVNGDDDHLEMLNCDSDVKDVVHIEISELIAEGGMSLPKNVSDETEVDGLSGVELDLKEGDGIAQNVISLKGSRSKNKQTSSLNETSPCSKVTTIESRGDSENTPISGKDKIKVHSDHGNIQDGKHDDLPQSSDKFNIKNEVKPEVNDENFQHENHIRYKDEMTATNFNVVEDNKVVMNSNEDLVHEVTLGVNSKENKGEGSLIGLEVEGTSLASTVMEGPVIKSEGLDLENSNLLHVEAADVTYATAPGLYTLLLNTDNTFTVVEGRYQETTMNNRIYVCRHCKIFASSQLEILHHITLCHPADLSDVNQCITECSSLTNIACDNDGTSGNASHDIISNVPDVIVDSNGMEGYDPRRTIRKKLGRPRKGSEVDRKEENSNEEKREAIKSGDVLMCSNCQKCFPKPRQFDKHKCCLWKVVKSEPEQSEELSMGDSSVGCLEDDAEEEWKAHKRYKPEMKMKGRNEDRRKRGRPPKVDVMTSKVVPPIIATNNCEEINGNHLSTHRTHISEDVSGSQWTATSNSASIGSYNVANPPLLNSIPSLPVFSNVQQQERLHKWIAQIDLSFVDGIIEKLCSDKGGVNHLGVEMYMCKECQAVFRSLLACRRHCAKHTTQKAFTCPDCDFASTNVGHLYSHYRNHTQNLYACNKCGFRARIKAHFRDHLETHNPNRYICRLCQRPYSTSNSLRVHIYSYHANKEGMEYLNCLRKKNQDRNTKKVFFQCPICSKLFAERSLANSHLASHCPSAPQVFIKCEVCYAETLNPDTLKKHMQKHKVVYICCKCHTPHVSANCLRNHQKAGDCQGPQPESFKQSVLLSFTSPDNFQSLLSNKKLGPLLQEKLSEPVKGDFVSLKSSDALVQQMEETGYKQIHVLLREMAKEQCSGNHVGKSKHNIMKIVINTRHEDKKQLALWEQHQPGMESTVYHHEKGNDQNMLSEAVHFEERECVTLKSREVGRPQNSSSTSSGDQICTQRVDSSPIYLPNQDPTSRESDQRVVVISNIGEEQTVVVEDGQMMMEEERFVIISDRGVGQTSIGFDKLFTDDG